MARSRPKNSVGLNRDPVPGGMFRSPAALGKQLRDIVGGVSALHGGGKGREDPPVGSELGLAEGGGRAHPARVPGRKTHGWAGATVLGSVAVMRQACGDHPTAWWRMAVPCGGGASGTSQPWPHADSADQPGAGGRWRGEAGALGQGIRGMRPDGDPPGSAGGGAGAGDSVDATAPHTAPCGRLGATRAAGRVGETPGPGGAWCSSAGLGRPERDSRLALVDGASAVVRAGDLETYRPPERRTAAGPCPVGWPSTTPSVVQTASGTVSAHRAQKRARNRWKGPDGRPGASGLPRVAGRRDPTGWHEAVDVWRVDPGPRPGVEHPQAPHPTAHRGGGCGELGRDGAAARRRLSYRACGGDGPSPVALAAGCRRRDRRGRGGSPAAVPPATRRDPCDGTWDTCGGDRRGRQGSWPP